MRKVILCVLVCFLLGTISKPVQARELLASNLAANSVSQYISSVFSKIDFGTSEHLSLEVFDKAYRGYMNLLSENKLNSVKHLLTVCDLSLPSTTNRMWIIDLDKMKVVLNTLVAHGQGSGKEYATSFSNTDNTHQSSLGFYVTGATYEGKHGLSLHLDGMDQGYNNAAYERGIVVHGADYVSKSFASANGYLGRSWGCPAVPSNQSYSIVNTIKDKTCLFIYYPEKKYLASSYWLNKTPQQMPTTSSLNML